MPSIESSVGKQNHLSIKLLPNSINFSLIFIKEFIHKVASIQQSFAGRFGSDFSSVNFLRLGAEVILSYGTGNSYLVDENEYPYYDGGMKIT
ncbi:MAG: hypothetical protein R3277_03905 [Brumimicrobium sp.]|nr:hypothetical protein [Brumimicrobium sp.]